MADYTHVKEILEVYSTSEVNQKLKENWILINTYTFIPDEYLKNDVKLVYVLGRI